MATLRTLRRDVCSIQLSYGRRVIKMTSLNGLSLNRIILKTAGTQHQQAVRPFREVLRPERYNQPCFRSPSLQEFSDAT